MNEQKYHTLKITLERISLPQAIALKKILEFMDYLGNIGSSRWVAFYADGDGDFRPDLKEFNYPLPIPETKKDVKEMTGTFYGIDFDSIAWELEKKKE